MTVKVNTEKKMTPSKFDNKSTFWGKISKGGKNLKNF